MMVQDPEEVDDILTDTQDTPILTQSSTSQPHKKHKPRTKQRKEQRVLSLEQTKTSQACEIEKLNKRVKKLKGKKKKKKKKKRTHGLKRLYNIGLSARIVSSDEEGCDEVFVDVITGENVEQDATVAENVVTTIEDIEVTDAAATTPQISKAKLTLAQTLMEIKVAKPNAKGVTIQETKPKNPLKKKDQIPLDEDIARKLEAEMKAEMDKEEMIAREKNEANIDVIEE
nr:hypothetical protein [Tanacetum cinerariifolium]